MTFDKIQEGVGLRQDAIHWFWPFYSSQLECCGTDGPKSWIKSTFNNYNFEGEELGLATSTEYYSIPRSCCRSVSRQIRAGHQLNEFSSRVIIMDIRFLWVWVYAAGKHSYRISITFKTNDSSSFCSTDARRPLTAPTTWSWPLSRSPARLCCSGRAACRSWATWWRTTCSTSSGASPRWRSWVRESCTEQWVSWWSFVCFQKYSAWCAPSASAARSRE